MDAIAYSRQHLSPWSDQYQADLQRALAALAFRAGAPSAILHCIWHASQGKASALHFSSSEGPQINRPLTPVQMSSRRSCCMPLYCESYFMGCYMAERLMKACRRYPCRAVQAQRASRMQRCLMRALGRGWRTYLGRTCTACTACPWSPSSPSTSRWVDAESSYIMPPVWCVAEVLTADSTPPMSQSHACYWQCEHLDYSGTADGQRTCHICLIEPQQDLVTYCKQTKSVRIHVCLAGGLVCSEDASKLLQHQQQGGPAQHSGARLLSCCSNCMCSMTLHHKSNQC